MALVNEFLLLTFGFVDFKWNTFETSYSIVKSYLIGHHLPYDNQSKDILNVFDLVLMRSCLMRTCFEMDMRKFC